jgi:hypothetical protein
MIKEITFKMNITKQQSLTTGGSYDEEMQIYQNCEDILNKYQEYLSRTEYKNLPQQLNVMSDSFCVCSKIEDDWWKRNVTQYSYIDYWNYLDISMIQCSYTVTNPLCKVNRDSNSNIFLEIHDEITEAEEPTSWLKARISLKNVNGRIVKNGVQEVWYDIPILTEDGYHDVEKEGVKTRYKLLRSPQMLRNAYIQGLKCNLQLKANIDYTNNTLKNTEIIEYKNGKIIRSQTWYASNKQKTHKYVNINYINNDEDSIIKTWSETGVLLSLTHICKNFIRDMKCDDKGKIQSNIIRERIKYNTMSH